MLSIRSFLIRSEDISYSVLDLQNLEGIPSIKTFPSMRVYSKSYISFYISYII